MRGGEKENPGPVLKLRGQGTQLHLIFCARATRRIALQLYLVSNQITINALFRRGVPQDTAGIIAGQGYTFAKLQQLSLDTLIGLGLEQGAAERIRDSKRPPVSEDVVARLMHECRRICCVCRESGKSLVLHHTHEWAESHSHDEKLLVVLCANCHGEAHTKRELGRNLTPEELLEHRALWAAKVAELEARSLLDGDASRHPLGMEPIWDYFNHRRISRTAAELSIEPSSLPSFARIARTAPLDDTGAIDWSAVHKGSGVHARYMYEGNIRNSDGVYNYFSDLLRQIILKSRWIDLRSVWTPAKLKAVALPGQVAILTAGFRFRSSKTMLSRGPGQDRQGYYKKEKIRIHFSFDGWETTSNSSHGNLSGIWRSTAVCIIRSVETESLLTTVEVTCLGIGTGFDQSYSPKPLIAYMREADEDEGDGFAEDGDPELSV